jgi:hypothetical protein
MSTTAQAHLEMFRDCLLRIAPVFARHALRRVRDYQGDPYSPEPNSGWPEFRRKICEESAQLAAQLALHLAAQYNAYYEAAKGAEAKDAPQTRAHPVEERLKGAAHSAPEIR